MLTGQNFFGLGRLLPEDRRYVEWRIDEIMKLRDEYTRLVTKIKWQNVLRPNVSLDPLIDELIYVSDCLWYQYAVIFAWLCHLGEKDAWAEIGYELFR